MTSNQPEPSAIPVPRATAAERAQRNLVVRLVTSVTTGAKQFVDNRRMNRLARGADKQARRDARANTPDGQNLVGRAYYGGLTKEMLAKQALESRAALVGAVEAAQAGQRGGADAQLRDGENAAAIGLNPPIAPGQQHEAGSAGGASVSKLGQNTERGKGGTGIGG